MSTVVMDTRRRSWGLSAGVAVIVLAGGGALAPADTLLGYLGAVLAFATVPLGALVLLFMMDVTGGAWRQVLSSHARSVASLLPAAAVAFIPVVVGMVLNIWGRAPTPDWTVFKTVYLAPWFLALRTVGYFLFWLWLWAWGRPGQGHAGAGALSLIALTITLSAAAVDWGMALERDFSSSIYGLIFLAHAAMAGLSAVLILHGSLSQQHRPMLGALLLTAVLIWAYMHAMQFIIVWAGNRPDDVVWYVTRSHGPWLVMLCVVAALGLAVPFIALLSPVRRAAPGTVAMLAASALAAMILEAFWLVVPGHATSTVPVFLGAAGGLILCCSLGAMSLAYAPPPSPEALS